MQTFHRRIMMQIHEVGEKIINNLEEHSFETRYTFSPSMIGEEIIKLA